MMLACAMPGLAAVIAVVYAYMYGMHRHAKKCKEMLESSGRRVTCEDLVFIDGEDVTAILGGMAVVSMIALAVLTSVALFLEGRAELGLAIAEAVLLVILLLRRD